MRPQYGDRLGPYQVLHQLGEGPGGAVYAAEHPILSRSVALAVLHPESARQKRLLKRFYEVRNFRRSSATPQS